MIRQDTISKVLLAVASMVTIFLATYQTTTVIIFPVILLVTGLSMEFLIERRHIEEDESIDGKEQVNIIGYTILGIITLMVTGYFINWSFSIPTAATLFPEQATIVMSFSSYDTLAYSILIAVAEEQFFRGFITDGLLHASNRIPLMNISPFFALMFSAVIFCAYQFARYGTQPSALVYVYIGGFILSFISYRTKRLSPAMFAHTFNNAASVLMGMI